MNLKDLAQTPFNTSVRKCPKCAAEKISRAHRSGFLDRVLSLVNIYPYRCRLFLCKKRFYRFGKDI